MRVDFKINPKQVRYWLTLLTFCVTVISLITEYLVEVILRGSPESLLLEILNLFSVNLEGSFPTWYTTLLLFVAAVLLTWIATVKLRAADAHRWYWAGLAAGFVYLSADEGAGIHEIFVDTVKQSVNTGGFFEFGWQLVAIPVVLVVLVIYVRFVYQLPRHTQAWVIVSASMYLGGALIVEGISANQWFIDGGLSMRYLSIATIEESLEMLGAVMFIYTLLDYSLSHDYALLLEYDAAVSTPRKTHSYNGWRSRGLPMLIGLNVMILAWLIFIAPHDVIPDDEEGVAIEVPFYYLIQDEIIADGGAIIEVEGLFGVDNLLSQELAQTLTEHYSDVIAVAQPTRNITTLIASHTVAIHSDDLTELLHGIGQTNFIIFNHETVKALSGIR